MQQGYIEFGNGNSDALLTRLSLERTKRDEPPLCEDKGRHRATLASKLGSALSWAANLVYIAARVPQIHKNYMRKSVEGLSMLMFCCSIGGNTSYSLSILLRMQPGRASFWVETFPYLLSCLITIGCDLTILMQSRWYKTRSDDDATTLNGVENGAPDAVATDYISHK